MVDFNNETIISQSPTEVLKLLILEKQDFTIEAVKVMFENYYRTTTYKTWVFKSSLQCIFWYINPMLKNSIYAGDSFNDKKITQDSYDQLKKNIDSSNVEDNLQALEFIQLYLYYKGLLKIDNKKNYDSSKPEAVNIAKDL